MSTVRRIFKNSWASLIIQISTPACSFVLVLFIARYLGASGLGKYASALSILFFFQAVASLGFPQLITREVAQDRSKADKFLINASLIGLVFAAITAVIMCLAAHLITDNRDIINSVYVLSISLVPYTLSIVCQSIHQGFEKFEYVMISVVIGNIFKLVVGYFILLKGYGLLNLMVVTTVGYTVIFIISLSLVLRSIPRTDDGGRKVDLGFCRWILGAMPVFALTMIVAAVRLNIDVIMLTNMVGEREVGFYSAAARLVNIFKFGVAGYIMAMQPVIFKLFKLSSEKFKRVTVDSIRYLIILIAPVVFITTFVSDRFVLLIFREEFLPSARVLSILIWLLVFNGLNQIFSNAQISSNNQKANFYANLIGGIANIVLNLLLIKAFGYIGAAISAVVSALIALLVQHRFISKYLFRIDYFYVFKKPVVASILAVSTVLLLSRDNSIWLLIGIPTVVYGLALWALKAFSVGDKDLVRRLLKGERNLTTE